MFSQCKNESRIKAIESVAPLATVIRFSLFFFIADILANLFLVAATRSEARLEGSIGTARRLLNQRH